MSQVSTFAPFAPARKFIQVERVRQLRWKEPDIADDKTLRGRQDSSRIAMGEEYEVAYWINKFGVTREQLQEAVNTVGNSTSAVQRYLNR